MKKTISAGEFKVKCLELMDRVNQLQTPIIITKWRNPVAMLVPFDKKKQSIWGAMADSVEILDDIIAPIDEEWDADS